MTRIVLAIGSFLFIYLLGAFVAADFNAANWHTEGRALIAIIGGFLSAIVFTAPYK